MEDFGNAQGLEVLLKKIAAQIDSIDEASMMSLCEKYGKLACSLPPSKEWEEAILILSIIQIKSMKNRLFNHHLKNKIQHDVESASTPDEMFIAKPSSRQQKRKPCPIIQFKPLS